MALSFLVFSFQFPVIKNLQHVKHSKNKLNFCRLVGAKFALKNQGSKRTFFFADDVIWSKVPYAL